MESSSPCPEQVVNAPKGPLRVVAVGASAGGLTALKALIEPLPGDFPWPIVVVQHLYPATKSKLPIILNRDARLRVKSGEAGDALAAGTVYVAPANHHMTVTANGILALNDNPEVNFSRPAIDILFASVAAAYGKGAIAIILTGANRDGADGIQAVKAAGGLTMAQSPETAQSPKMPQAAINTGAVDSVMAIAEITDKLMQLTCGA